MSYKGTHKSLWHGQHVEKSVFFKGPCPVLEQHLFHCSSCCFEDEGEGTASLLETLMQLSFPQLPDLGVNVFHQGTFYFNNHSNK